MEPMVKSIKEQLLERNYWRKVKLVQQQLNLSSEDIDLVSRYEDVIERLERLALGLDKFDNDEPLESIAIYVNGVFVYEEDFNNGSLINALPSRHDLDIRIVEIVVNEKLAIVVERRRAILNMLDRDNHYDLVNKLRSTSIWQQITGRTTKD